MAEKKDYSSNRPNGGRPPDLTMDKIETICRALMVGVYPETAFKLAGFSGWQIKMYAMRAMERPESIYGTLVERMKLALAQAELRDLAQIDLASQGRKTTYLRDNQGNLILDSNGDPIIETPGLRPDWKASAWKLERRFKNRWSQSINIQNLVDPIEALDNNDDKLNSDPKKDEIEVKELARKILIDDPDAE